MTEWTTPTDRPGYRCKRVEAGNATIIIYRPIHSEAEAAKAKEKARAALENVMREHCITTNRKEEAQWART